MQSSRREVVLTGSESVPGGPPLPVMGLSPLPPPCSDLDGVGPGGGLEAVGDEHSIAKHTVPAGERGEEGGRCVWGGAVKRGGIRAEGGGGREQEGRGSGGRETGEAHPSEPPHTLGSQCPPPPRRQGHSAVRCAASPTPLRAHAGPRKRPAFPATHTGRKVQGSGFKLT